MLLIRFNQLEFEYDILSLVKAFYPICVVKMLLSRECTSLAQVDEDPAIDMCFEEKCIKIGLYENRLFQYKIAENHVDLEESDTRLDVKNKLKRLLYDMLSDYTKEKLPWGTLTGIRPTKIPMAMLEAGEVEQTIIERMQETYYITREKAELSIDIAKREIDVLSTLHEKVGYSLYIGIPFCPTTCLYCSFTSYPRKRFEKQIGNYLQALFQELDFVKDACKERILDTIYIGGGTPTTLTADELRLLMEKITATFPMDTVQEFTVEAGRADSITKEKLEVLYQYGVTRISVNPQTMNEETLRIIGRNHTVDQVKKVFFMAREVGFANINMDIILGLPDETEDDLKHTMKEIKELNPDSLTVHSLALKRASGLSEWIEVHGMDSLHNSKECMEITQNAATEMGMLPYYLYRQKNMAGNFENVGYARPDKFGIYNVLIMEEKQDIIAVGAGSITKIVCKNGRMKRCDCVKDVQMYIDQIEDMIERKRRLMCMEEENGTE